MDLRKWLLLNDPPPAADLARLTRHVPCSDYRSPPVLEVFIAGFYTGFKLTDSDGQPTIALETMARVMGVELCTAGGIPDHERTAFGIDRKALVNRLAPTWYIRGITERVKAAWSMSGWQNQWVYAFLPGLDGARVSYRDPDGKRRKRVCYMALCKPDWELTDDVYQGIHKWRYDHHCRWSDAYTILRADQALRESGVATRPPGDTERPSGSAPAEGVQAALCSPEGSPEGGQVPPIRDCRADQERRGRVEALLLLRDLWEVLQITEHRLTNNTPKELPFFYAALRDLMNHPFGGEEVLF